MPSAASTRAAVDPFLAALNRYWGYNSFRPRQEEVVRALAEGRDACVVMPTGGGKSLCYQLPAVLDSRHTAIVISPLIALMQDQVAQLTQMGIPAAFLNSAVPQAARRELREDALSGKYRLLYISPERGVMDETARWLKQVPVSFFAIDEAHCISEWGHDFRPEYRQLSKLRELFPDRPIIALTASATRQVRHDIVEQLHLREPLKSVSSFRRENLRYIVKETPGSLQEHLLLECVRRVKSGSVIVYSPTVARVGETVDLLAENGIPAIGYHGQMETAARRDAQERWMAGEFNVLVGTIAFGLGINKPDVRAVIRLGLPDTIEQLYQETGRAGRDGLPSDCYLFWQKRDKARRAYFINQIGDSGRHERAWTQYHQMEAFATGARCRVKMICEHFGEAAKWASCGLCDTCAGEPAWLSSASSTSSAGKPSRKRPASTAQRTESALYEPSPAIEVDAELRDFLREWRRNLARENKVPAFVILHDTTLEAICNRKPRSLAELRTVPGIGDSKCESYGQDLLQLLRRFEQGERAGSEWHARPTNPSQETRELLEKGHTFEEISQMRGRKVSSVVHLVADLIERGEIEFRKDWVHPIHAERIRQAAARLGLDLLKPIKDSLPAEVTYEEVRLVVADERRRRNTKNTQ